MDRKIVFWINQGHMEAFVKTAYGWAEAGKEFLDWPAGSYACVDVRASDEDFGTRKNGCVCV